MECLHKHEVSVLAFLKNSEESHLLRAGPLCMIKNGEKSPSVKRLMFIRATNLLPSAVKSPFESSNSSAPHDEQPDKVRTSACSS